MRAVISNGLLKTIQPVAKPYEIWDSKLTGFLIRVQPSGRMTYMCQYARGKRASIGPVGTLTPAEARDLARQMLADVLRGADPQAERRAAQSHTLKSYILDVYAPWAETHHRDGTATIGNLKANFFSTLGDLKLSEITAWSIEKWRSERLKGGTKPSSVNRYLNPLKAALTRAVDWGFLSENPLAKVKPLRTDSQASVRFLSDEEESRLRAALDAREKIMKRERRSANAWRKKRGYKLLPAHTRGFADHLKPMVILSLNTGLRRGELFNLTWGDIDLERAMLTVGGQGAKSGQTRHVPLNDEALGTLRRWRAQNLGASLVFPSASGERFTNVTSAWRNLLKDAKITSFRWHDMRHHFASRLVMEGVDLNTVRELLGHADTKMTLRYAHLAPAVKANAVARLVRRSNKHETAKAV
jgi:integrase